MSIRANVFYGTVAAMAMGFAGVLVAAWLPWWSSRPDHPDTAAFETRLTGVELTADLRSYMSEEAVLRRYPDGVQVHRILRPATPDHPPRNLVTLELMPFTHLGVDGRMTLDFFNDRLMEMTFSPGDIPAYAAALSRAEPGLRRNATGRRDKIEGQRRVASNVAQLETPAGQQLGAMPFTLWQDRRLRAQLDDWDTRFGHFAPPAKR